MLTISRENYIKTVDASLKTGYTNDDLMSIFKPKDEKDEKKVRNLTDKLLRDNIITKLGKVGRKTRYILKKHTESPSLPKESSQTKPDTINLKDEITMEQAGDILFRYIKKIERRMFDLENNLIEFKQKLDAANKTITELNRTITKQNETILKANIPNEKPKNTGWKLGEIAKKS